MKEALEKFGEEFINELYNRLLELDKRASGELLESLDYYVRKNRGDSWTLFIQAAEQLKYVDEGRRPGAKPPPVDAIEEWCNSKYRRIDENLAYPIAIAIGRNGIEPTNVLEESIEEMTRESRIRELEDDNFDYLDGLINDMLLRVSKNKNIIIR